MGITIHDRFENQIKKFLLERIDDSKKRGGYEENDDPYDDKFEELMNDDELYNSHENKYTDDYEKKEDLLKENMNSRPLIKNHPAKNSETYKMNTRSTIEHIRDQFDDDGKKWFGKMIDSGVGGTEGWRAHLKGTDSEYFMTSSSEKKATGNFLTKEHPGKTAQERKENLQLPEGNDANYVEKVLSQKPAVVLESTVAPQEEWANKAGYKAKEGMKQVFTPVLDKEGAIHSGIYEIKDSDGLTHNSMEENIRNKK